MAGLTIQEMRLSPQAERAARLVLERHPNAWFTSGRRDLMDQARAMAQNAVAFGSGWLDDTYKNKRIVKHLMTYMEENPERCRDAKVLGHHFYEELQEHFAGEFTKFPHLRGDAFDIRYPRLKNGLYDRPSGDQIMATIRSLPEHGIALEWVTDQEGRLIVIHAQFKADAGSVEV